MTKQLSIFAWVKWNKGGIKHVDPLWWPMIVMKASVNKTYLLFLDTGDGVNPNKPSIAFRMSGPGTVYSKETVKEEVWYHAVGTYDDKATPHFSVCSSQYRYTRCANGEEELYDHNQDPHEWTNLAANEAFASIKKEVGQQLMHQLKESKIPSGYKG